MICKIAIINVRFTAFVVAISSRTCGDVSFWV